MSITPPPSIPILRHSKASAPPLPEALSTAKTIKTKAELCSRQLKGWIQSIQNSDFKGERHVNARTKRLQQAAREREEFLKELAEVRAQGA